LTLFQAFADDSAAETGDQRLFLAGYINTDENWQTFSDTWAGALRDAPSIPYFRMSEANARRGPFEGWSEANRDKKLLALAAVINQLKPMSFEFSVSRREYYRLIRPNAPRGIGTPHFVCTFLTIGGIARYVSDEGLDVPIEFIFDEQVGVSDDTDLFFTHMKGNLPPEARRLIRGNPVYRDDKSTMPLQAADMLAWHLRREHEFGALPAGAASMADVLRNEKGHLTARIEVEDLERWREAFSKMPGLELVQSKSQWRNLKKEIRRLLALGFKPPFDFLRNGRAPEE
jgi:hypothetical protein